MSSRRKLRIAGLSVLCVATLAWTVWVQAGRMKGHPAKGQPAAAAGGATKPASQSGSQPADDIATVPEAKNGLIGALQSQIMASPVLNEEGTGDPLLAMLSDADEMLSAAKMRNREAIRQANRQVRVGAARLSPHFILVLADELSPDRLGCYGASTAATPNIDRLAAEGMRFTNFYSGGAQPEVGFWSLMTGRNASRAPKGASNPYVFDESQNTIADVLWRAGYTTTFLGMWPGPERPVEQGFDDWVGRFPTTDAADAFPEHLLSGRSQMKVLENTAGQRGATFSRLLAAETESFLTRYAKSDRPFLLVIRLPSTAVCELAEGQNKAAETWDQFVGDVAARVSENNLQRRVCLMFTGLSGSAGADAPALTEGTIKTPLIVNWAGGIPKGTISDHVCVGWDIMPTLVELARVSPKPAEMDGISFNPSLRRLAQPQHPLLFWELRGKPMAQAVRKGKWKGVYVAGEPGLRLYDLEQDPAESRDVSKEHPDVVKQLVVKPAKPRRNDRG